MWKYVDDTTIAEAVDSRQEVVLSKWKTISQGKKGMTNFKISCGRNEPEFEPICVNPQTLETVNSVKLLGLNVSGDIKWNVQVSEQVRKVSARLYFLRQLKKAHVATRQLILFYIKCFCSIIEYGSPVFHCTLPSCLSEDLERLQKCAMKIIYPDLSYAKALELSGLLTLYDKCDGGNNAVKLFDEICSNQSHSLHKLLPSKYQPSYSERTQYLFTVLEK